jgi:rhodanese-related sulfurtransferase
MKKTAALILGVFLIIALVPGAYALDQALAKKLSDVLSKGPSMGNFQVKADEVAGWIAAKKTDFLVVDVRPNPAEYKAGHIPGSIYIAYSEILKPENLKKLPADKKIILVCVTGQTQNLPIVALRALGFDARTMSFGYAAWIPGYQGFKMMQAAQANAVQKEFPVVK